jgi:hypothetical protein
VKNDRCLEAANGFIMEGSADRASVNRQLGNRIDPVMREIERMNDPS